MKIENCKTNWVKSLKLKVLVTRRVMSQDKSLAVLTTNQADPTPETTVSLIVRGWFPLRGRRFLRQHTAFAGSEKEMSPDAVLLRVEVERHASSQRVKGTHRLGSAIAV